MCRSLQVAARDVDVSDGTTLHPTSGRRNLAQQIEIQTLLAPERLGLVDPKIARIVNDYLPPRGRVLEDGIRGLKQVKSPVSFSASP